jgi:dsDNA-binding SOS-regulon protein
MYNPAAETYLGDDSLKCLLKEIGTSLSVYEVKAMILGAINNVELVPPSQIIDAISKHSVNESQEEISYANKDQAMRFYGQLLSCWNSLCQSEGAPKIFSPMPKNIDRDELFRVVAAKYNELTAFLTFVDADEQMEDFIDKRALDAFSNILDLEGDLFDFIEYDPEDFEKCREEVLTLVNNLHRTWEVGFPFIKKQLSLLRLQKAETLKRQSHGSKLTLKVPSKNSPCQCGSGKKFKRCCGIE